MRIAIHQPNFFPWLGFFNKILLSDKFIYLDHVKNNPRDFGWFKSVNIIANKNKYLLTQPLKHPETFSISISEMKIVREKQFTKNLKTISHNYSSAPYFSEVFPLIEEYHSNDNIYLADKNIDFIEMICKKLSLTNERIRSSKYKWSSNSTNLLIDIVQKFSGTSYLCGGGATGYQEDHKFEKANLKLIYQNFKHPIYKQANSELFIKGLSIIDALMNLGFNGVEALLKQEKQG